MPRHLRKHQHRPPSSVLVELASSNSFSTRGPSAFATDSLDQVLSEGASSAFDAAVRLSMKRSSDSSHSESETKRLHIDHSKRNVAMFLDGSDIGRKFAVGVRRFLSM